MEKLNNLDIVVTEHVVPENYELQFSINQKQCYVEIGTKKKTTQLTNKLSSA